MSGVNWLLVILIPYFGTGLMLLAFLHFLYGPPTSLQRRNTLVLLWPIIIFKAWRGTL